MHVRAMCSRLRDPHGAGRCRSQEGELMISDEVQAEGLLTWTLRESCYLGKSWLHLEYSFHWHYRELMRLTAPLRRYYRAWEYLGESP